MEPDKLYTAKVVVGLMNAADALKDALSGAQMAKDNKLFGEIFKKQSELWDMASALIKDKNANNQAV